MQIIRFILLLIVLNATQVRAQENRVLPQKLSAQQMQSDLHLLKKILEANHPGLYWYSTKENIDTVFENTVAGISDSLTEVAFRNRVAAWVNEIKCGHTVVRMSKKWSGQQLQKNKSQQFQNQFPLQIKVWEDSLVVMANMNRKDALLKKGTIIHSINGQNNRELLSRMFTGISTDGNSINHKNQVVSNSFPFWYTNYFGTDTLYHIRYTDGTGNKLTAAVQPFSYKPARPGKAMPDTVNRPEPAAMSKRQMQQLMRRSLTVDTVHQTAVMRLTSFSKGSLKHFFRKSFREIKKLGVKNLVIDLRNNGGGKVDNSILLTRFLSNHPFKIGDTVVAINRKFNYGRYIHGWLPFWFAMNIGGKKTADGAIHYRRYETHYFTPKERNHFNGNLYLLQGGYTFSAATMFIATLKGQQNTTVVGEETGGGYYGNSAMHIPTIVLPSSGLRISLPMYRLVMDKNRPKGNGIIPDIIIPPSSAAIKAGIDLKMDSVQSIIQQNLRKY